MNPINKLLPLLVLALGMATTGCNDPGEQSVMPIETAAAPATLQEAFKDAPAETKAEAEKVAALMTGKNYGGALLLLERLAYNPSLTPEQRGFVSRARLTAQNEVAGEAARGDQQAQELLRYRSASK